MPSDVVIELRSAAWIFLSASFDERHLYDIVWACEALKAMGDPEENLFIFLDHPSPDSVLKHFNLQARVRALGAFESDMHGIGAFQYAFCVTTGHGSHLGIHNSSTIIKPVKTLAALRKIKDLKRGFLILGQCYGGVFDGLEASIVPEIGVMGAAKLSPSVSSMMPSLNHKVKLQAPQLDAAGASAVKDVNWGANPFIFHFFSWIREPVDTDGDERLTVLDAYKYAGAMTNNDVTSMRVMRSLELDPKFSQAKQKLRDHIQGTSRLDPVEFQTQFTILEAEAAFLYFHQEPWALHVNLVRSSILKF